WSVKVTIGHVAYYEHWLQDWLEAAVRGKVTAASHRDVLDVEERNALIWGENRVRALTDIVEESRLVYERLLQLVKLLSDQDLFAPHAYDRYVLPFWNTSQPLSECIRGDSYGHYEEHTENIHRWLDAEKRVAKALVDNDTSG
ncbi:MAG: ClbS/DfsB family four-helix bundle protein, partial [Chloroflexi bacterium]|nr:ClbS/DfsB family four-helix bundle protein [Chloroflexota bacterium]